MQGTIKSVLGRARSKMQGMIESVLGYARSTVLGTKRIQGNGKPQVRTLQLLLRFILILPLWVAVVTETVIGLLNMTVSS